jgi:nucleotide-binding universal stress UspA family protein
MAMDSGDIEALRGSHDWRPKTIVVGYNGTSSAEWALYRAIQVARAFSAQVVVADVAVPTELQETPGAFGYLPYYGDMSEGGVWTDEVLWQQHRSRIETLFAPGDIRHEFSGLIGEPVSEILDVAEERNADLIVVGTREPGFLARVLGASVSQDLARHAHCDVLVVHAPEG